MTDAFAGAREARLEKYRRRAIESADRVARGESWAEVAASYGIVDVKSFRRRVKAHVGEVERHNFALDVILEVEDALEEFRLRLAEIRSRYE